MQIVPLGTIIAWTPFPEQSAQKVEIPQCWIACNGSMINEGIWKNKRTPDINNQNRYLAYHWKYLQTTM